MPEAENEISNGSYSMHALHKGFSLKYLFPFSINLHTYVAQCSANRPHKSSLKSSLAKQKVDVASVITKPLPSHTFSKCKFIPPPDINTLIKFSI